MAGGLGHKVQWVGFMCRVDCVFRGSGVLWWVVVLGRLGGSKWIMLEKHDPRQIKKIIQIER